MGFLDNLLANILPFMDEPQRPQPAPARPGSLNVSAPILAPNYVQGQQAVNPPQGTRNGRTLQGGYGYGQLYSPRGGFDLQSGSLPMNNGRISPDAGVDSQNLFLSSVLSRILGR